jgi:uncharacterized protein YcfJ
MTTLTRSITLPALLALSSLAVSPVQAQEIQARVISSTAVIQQVAVPRQQCTNTPVTSTAPPSGAGALMGALAGGALGNAVGDGSGRALATMIGVMGGAIVGNNVEGPKTQTQNVQQCSTVTTYENRTMHYDVVYEYADKRYNIQMANDPGAFVRLQVSPIGILPPASRSPQSYQQYQTEPATVIVSRPTVYVQPATVQVYQAPQVRYYPAPYYNPIGISLNLDYSRGGNRNRNHSHSHWR